MVLLAAWCGLRFGEPARSPAPTSTRGRHRHGAPRRGATPGEFIAGDPKSAAGKAHRGHPTAPARRLDWHLDHHVRRPDDSPVFSRYDAGYGGWHPLTASKGRSGRPATLLTLRFHDLRLHRRHLAAAATGATSPTSWPASGTHPAMALRYQHAVHGRDQQIAAAPSGFARGQRSSP